MKRAFIAAMAAMVFAAAAAAFPAAALAAPEKPQIRAVLGYHPGYLQASPHILAAYASVLQEEGVPHESVDVARLVDADPGELAKSVPVVILPDGLAQTLPPEFDGWVREYLAGGGNLAVIYDAGIRSQEGFYLGRSQLADIVGVNYMTYSKTGAAAYDMGSFSFTCEPARDLFQIPMGKTVDGVTVSSYSYGALQYPLARSEQVRELPAGDIYAYGVTGKQEKFPALVMTDYARGKVLYVNLPLGYLKAYSDDLPLRAMLRTFLFDVVGMPHIMNVEDGRGGLVINWHVDADIEHISLPFLLKRDYFRKELPFSFHITAGDFFLTPGDDIGFDAGGLGRRLTLLLKEHGRIGSHGGWAHNWFSENVIKGVFKEKEIKENIARNNEALEKIVGYKITEYAAPNGVHPQPAATRALEELGMVAYYYAGDTGSAPNRAFADGKMVSDKVVAFPLMPFGTSGSIWEMKTQAKKSEAEVAAWFSGNLEYVSRNRTVRMIYSHPYDIQNYPQAIKGFLDKAAAMKTGNEISVRPMSEYAQFFLRFLKTEYTFSRDRQGVVISLRNPEGLTGVTVALPKKMGPLSPAAGLAVAEDERYYYLTVVGTDEKEKTIVVADR